jgi:hypothetical protein
MSSPVHETRFHSLIGKSEFFLKAPSSTLKHVYMCCVQRVFISFLMENNIETYISPSFPC